MVNRISIFLVIFIVFYVILILMGNELLSVEYVHVTWNKVSVMLYKEFEKKMLIDIFFSIFQSMIDKLFNLRKVLKDRIVFWFKMIKKTDICFMGNIQLILWWRKIKFIQKYF